MTSHIPDHACLFLERERDGYLKYLASTLTQLSSLQGVGDFEWTLKKVKSLLLEGEHEIIEQFLNEEIAYEEERIMENGGLGSSKNINGALGEQFHFEKLYENGQVYFPLEKKQRLDSLWEQAKEFWEKRNPNEYRDTIIAMEVLCRFKYY